MNTKNKWGILTSLVGLAATAGVGFASQASASDATESYSTPAVVNSADEQPAKMAKVKEIPPPADLLALIRAKRASQPGGVMQASPPSDVKCWNFDNNGGVDDGIGCFEWNGDDLWVKDVNSNGMNFRIHAETNYDRDEYCYAPGGPGWSECDYNFRETSCIRLHGYHPPHASSPGSPWAPWVRVSNGALCQ